MALSGADLLSSVRRSFVDLAELYALLEGGVFDVTKEALFEFEDLGSIASQRSRYLYIDLPQNVRRENLDVSVDPNGNLSIRLEGGAEWVALHVFLDFDATRPCRVYIESLYLDPAQVQDRPEKVWRQRKSMKNFVRESPTLLEKFLRLYTDANDKFYDTPAKSEQIRLGMHAFDIHKFEPEKDNVKFTGRNSIIFLFHQPVHRILIGRLRIYCI